MVSGSGSTDYAAQFQMARKIDENWKKSERRVLSIILIVVSGIIMIAGIKVIGQSQDFIRDSDRITAYWHMAQLEWGIFFTLIGTLAAVFSVMFLISTWREKKRA